MVEMSQHIARSSVYYLHHSLPVYKL